MVVVQEVVLVEGGERGISERQPESETTTGPQAQSDRQFVSRAAPWAPGGPGESSDLAHNAPFP